MEDLIEFKDFTFKKSEIQGIGKQLGSGDPQIKVYVIVSGKSHRVVAEQSHLDTDKYGEIQEQLDKKFKEVQKKVFGDLAKKKVI